MALALRRIPALLLEVWQAAGDRNLGLISAGVAFFALLAIFPATAALIALWGFLADPMVVEAQLELLHDIVPEEALSLLSSQVGRLVSTHDSTLGWTTLMSMAVALWSARLGVAALLQGLNAVHGTANRSGPWHVLAAITLTVVLIGVAIVAMASIVLLPVILAFIPLGAFTEFVLGAVKWVVALSVVLGGIALVYRYGPNRRPRTPWLSPGLGLAVMLWAAASVAFSWFLANFGNYNEVYGSIGAVVALLMWFYISAYAVLLGGVLNAALDRDEATEAGRAAAEDASPA